MVNRKYSCTSIVKSSLVEKGTTCKGLNIIRDNAKRTLRLGELTAEASGCVPASALQNGSNRIPTVFRQILLTKEFFATDDLVCII